MTSIQFDDSGLSLEGTKITATVLSAPPKLRSRPSSAAGLRIKATTSENGHNGSTGRNVSSARGPVSSNNTKPGSENSRIDFLSLFESQGRQRASGQARKSKLSGSGSVACASNASGVGSNFSHSVFVPMSARSDSSAASNNDKMRETPRCGQSDDIRDPLESHRSASSAHSDRTLSAESESIHTELSNTEVDSAESGDDIPSSSHMHDTDERLFVVRSHLNGSSIVRDFTQNSDKSGLEGSTKNKAQRTLGSRNAGGSLVDVRKDVNIRASTDGYIGVDHRNVSKSVLNKTSRNEASSTNSASYKNNMSARSNVSLRQRRNSDSAAAGRPGTLPAGGLTASINRPGNKSFLNERNGVHANKTPAGVKRSKQSEMRSYSKPSNSQPQRASNNTPRAVQFSANQQLAESKNLNLKHSEAAAVIQQWYRSHRGIKDVPADSSRPGASLSGNGTHRVSRSGVETQRASMLGGGDGPDHTDIIKEVKHLLEAKKEEFQQTSNGLAISMNREANQAALKKERARRARQQAIEDLHAKREENRQCISAEDPNNSLPPSSRSVHSTAPSGEVKTKHNGVSNGPVPSRPQSRMQTKSGALMSARSTHSGQNLRDAAKIPATGNENESTQRDTSSTVVTDQARTKSAVEELMETLKKLEEEEKFLTPRNELSWKNDKSENGAAHGDQSPEHTCRTIDRQPDKVLNSQYLSRDKLESIMNYLDRVDSSAASGMEQDYPLINNTLDTPALLVPPGDEIYQLEHASQTASEVTEHMLKQRMELEENRRTVMLLKKALGQQRELTVRQAKETEVDLKKRLNLQKEEYEDAVKRHLSFIDQLIDDKKSLSEKCEQLVREMKTSDKKYQDKIKLLKENQEIEMRKLKEVQAATEKLRREKWIEEKTKKIKELTVRGLEPEIQKLVAQHKAEVKKLKSIQEAELLAADERAGQRYVKMTEELRDQLAHEKEAACARERELARQTYEKQLSNEERMYQQQRQRLYSEVQEEKERLAEAAQRQRVELDRLQRQLEETHSSASETLRTDYEAGRAEQQRRHEAELKDLKERLEGEKESWMENYRRKSETNLLQKERELKEQVKRDRDKEIEMVIERLEEDNRISREECDRAAENKIKRIREKYEGELVEVEKSERLITEKYNQIKAKLADVEGEYERLKVSEKIKNKDVEELKKLLDKRNEERDHISDVIRQEFVDRIVATEEESKRLKNEVSELKARHRVELERGKADIEILSKTKDDELEQVHKRVKEAIVKKEEVVTQLRKQYEAAVKRADHLEGLLEQQRKQLLGKK